MKQWTMMAVVCAVGATAMVGCSTAKQITGAEKSAEQVVSSGPVVLQPRVNPGTIELNRDLQPNERPEVLVEVKDFKAPVNNVELRFLEVPMNIRMRHVGGTTWRAELPSGLIQNLAVNNQTTTYRANIYAMDENGSVGVLREPFQIAVKGPDLSQTG
jgi:hypothetical protein